MAGSIKLFQFFKKCHKIFGIHPSRPNQKLCSTNLTRATVLISCTQFLLTMIAFVLFEAKSMFEYGFAFYALICIIIGNVMYLMFIWQSKNILKIIENYEGFIEKRRHSTTAYNKLIEQIELFNQFLSCGLGLLIVNAFVAIIPFSYVRYYIFDMEEDSFYLFAPAWFPFDWNTPFGYLVACLSQCTGVFAVGCVISHFLNIVFGSYWLFIFIAEDITQDVVAFNFIAKPALNENRAELAKSFCDMVQIYSDAKQCVMEFNNVFKYSLFAFFSWDMLSVSSLLVTIQFELWADDPNLFEITLLTVILIWIITFIFLLCEPGERFTNRFGKFSDEFNRCDWYLLPIELKRWYIIFVSDTENPIKVSSYANIVCERETSKKMINTAFSYFMTFRKFKP